ncbi:unnamed protein product [Allacma fusca]|uniref:Importin N-terminal domain-containing protein n=1 Tax=Allacma fusca TaxID=39272 RepID=A0A8J2PW20_9HEXA|nr:unnamed protein product [Allacma fusca]
MDSTLSNAVENFIRSIQIELNPSSTPEERQTAHIFCETFRTHEPISTVATVGIVLTTKLEVEVVFSGLRIIEDLTKYHWATLDCRDVIKNRLMYLLENGFLGLPNQPGFLKEALARTIVEIAKREWPQLWPDLVPSLFTLGKRSILAYIVLRRLFEDIALCQEEDSFSRKRELLQSLVAVSTETVPTLFELLGASLEECSINQTQINIAKCKMFFGSILPFIELAATDLFLERNRITLLFQLTRHLVFRSDAAECILQLLQRKDKREKAKVYVELMKDVNFGSLQEAIRQEGAEELHFIKQMSDVLSFIGSSCGKDRDSLTKFFSLCESMASKSAAAAVVGTAIAFHNFMKTTVDSKDKDCLKDESYSLIINSILNLMMKKLVSTPVPGEKDELGRLKHEFCTTLRLFSKVRPMYLFLSPWIISALNDPGTMEVIQWEALGSLIDNVTSTISHEEEEVVHLGLQHLEQSFIKYSSEEKTVLKSAILSTVSGLFIFLSLAKKKAAFTSETTNLMCSILKSLFHCFTYPESERLIRRHVASLFIKLAKDNGELFIEMFDSIHQETVNMKDKLNSMEYVSLIECLLITSNRWNDRTQQLVFIQSLIAPSEWQEIASICHSTTEFATLFTEEVFYQKRPVFLRNLSLLVALFNRVQFTTESQTSSDFAESLFNLIRPTFPVVLELTKTLHSLILDPATNFLLDMYPAERNSLLGFVDHSVEDSEPAPKSVKEKFQIFVRALEDSTYTILGGCGPKFGNKLYSIPHIVDAYLSYIGDSSAKMNDFQIRRFLKMVYRPFLQSCPFEYVETVMIPFIQQFGPFLLNRLVARWQSVDFDSMDDDNAPSEEAEIVENATLRLLTKEYFDLLLKLLEMSKSSDDIHRTFSFGGGMDLDDEMPQNGHGRPQQGSSSNEIGEVGKLLLNDVVCFQAIIHLCANALGWKFSQVNLKAARCLMLSMKFIGLYPDVVRGVFTVALKAVSAVKEVEMTFDPLFRILDVILSDYSSNDPSILELFKNWGASEEDVVRMLQMNKGNQSSIVKKRKEIIRNIVQRTNSSQDPRLKNQWLTQLPKLLIYNNEKASKKESASKEVDLRECRIRLLIAHVLGSNIAAIGKIIADN